MADSKKKPWGDAFALIQQPTNPDQRDRFVPIGVVWATDNGNLRFTIDAHPMAWSDPKVERRVLIKMRKGASR